MALESFKSFDLFLYGTLRDPDLLSLVAGRPASDLQLKPATADGMMIARVRDYDYPMMIARDGSTANGLLLINADVKVLERLIFFEEAYGYGLADVEVCADGIARPARFFLIDDPKMRGDGPWDLASWQHDDQGLSLEVAADIMSIFEQQTPNNTPVKPARITERAESRIRAKNDIIHNVIKHSFSNEDVRVESLTRPYSKFFAVEDYVLAHRTFGGGWSKPMSRTALISADAVTVLPYDPVLDKVVLIEQFRVGAYVRGDRQPWLLEIIAGRCDSGQTPEEVARREAVEEAGLTLERMDLIAKYYTSPGAYNEYVYSYIGLADLSFYKEVVHGLGYENEDIATHLVDFEDLLPLVTSGEANNTPLIISILWLAINRERLQKEWTGA